MNRKASIIITLFAAVFFLYLQEGSVFAAEIDQAAIEETITEPLAAPVEVVEEIVDAIPETVVENESVAEASTESEQVVESEEDEIDVVKNIVSLQRPDYIRYEMPQVEDSSHLFDFIADPSRIINLTNAIMYNDATFDEGSFFFRNSEGEYDYSSHSDRLTIKNGSSVPLLFTITLNAKSFEGTKFSSNPSFNDDGAYIYLAIEDSEGNIVPVDESGNATLVYEIPAGFEPTYELAYDEEGNPILVISNMDETETEYYFTITGACNDNEAWADVSGSMSLSVKWDVEPIIEDSFYDIEIDENITLDSDEEPESDIDELSSDDELEEAESIIEDEIASEETDAEVLTEIEEVENGDENGVGLEASPENDGAIGEGEDVPEPVIENVDNVVVADNPVQQPSFDAVVE